MKYIVWEYKPDHGGEIEILNIWRICRLFDQQEIFELHKVILAPLQKVVHVNEIGDFRRIA